MKMISFTLIKGLIEVKATFCEYHDAGRAICKHGMAVATDDCGLLAAFTYTNLASQIPFSTDGIS